MHCPCYLLGRTLLRVSFLCESGSELALCVCNPCVQELSLQDISNLLWAYAVLGAMPQRLAMACAGELKRRLPTERAMLQHITNSVWSLCVAQV